GFAQYLSTYYVGEVLGGHPMQAWLTDSYDSYPQSSALCTPPSDDPGPARLFDSAVYARGAMAVQALRHRIGDTAFWTLLPPRVAQRAYRNGPVAPVAVLSRSG